MKQIKKLMALLLCAVVLCSAAAVSGSNIKAEATTNGITQAQAVEWINARVNEHWCQDYDGFLGCQCVDLVIYYYQYLTGSYTYGYAYAYETNTLPSGWVRYWGAVPQPGDVLVWSQSAAGNSTGHVGICISADAATTYYAETNGRYGTACYANSRATSGITCVIRPDFGTAGTVTSSSSTSASTSSTGTGTSTTSTSTSTTTTDTVDLSGIFNVETLNAFINLAKVVLPIILKAFSYARTIIANFI